MLRAAILGASGYTGGELLRILALHSGVEVVYASSREYAGYPIHHVHPHLRGFYRGMRFERLSLDKLLSLDVDVVFSALPHGVGLKLTASLYEHGVQIVDLSADYRLRDPSAYTRWYGFEHPYPDLLSKAVYGLPELHRDELRGARLIASPGCNATAAILAAAPLVRFGLLEKPIRLIVDVKASSSEGGSKPRRGSHHPEREGALHPYSASGHRHAAEVLQELSRLAPGDSIVVSLVPHAVSSVRGVLASAHSWARPGVTLQELARAYAEMYAGEPFVRIVSASPPGHPDTKNVVGSNYADVGYALEESVGRVTGFAALDNLVKGAAGQAVQAFNVSRGYPETEGLRYPPIHP
jgi:N-acetyl-gamma-glutamyl-phosphate/LysW-gamma-L-alpha-aminoadipyl-6-phosphate reductase